MRASLADHFAEVLLSNPQLEHVRVGAHDLVDLHSIGTVDDGLHYHLKELFHS